MEFIFLGTGAGKPSKERNVTAIVLDLMQERKGLWLFDCGEATQHQMLKAGLSPVKIESVFITHLHGDHIFGLPGLLSSRSMDQSQSPLTLYGPPGLKIFIETVLKISESYLTYPLQIIEIEEGEIFDDGEFSVSAVLLQHRITCFGYRIEEKDKPGALDVQRLTLDGVPAGPYYAQLKKGESVQLDDGRLVEGRKYLGPERPGKILAIFGDTEPTPNALKLAQNADVMIHEATLEGTLAEKANAVGHSTTVQAAELAKKAQAKRLIITHFSSRYSIEDNTRLLTECQAVFPEADIAFDLARFKI